MSLVENNEKCAVCCAYLFEEDDIVYCPVCGAPHHRDCYNAIGKCGMSEFHGTDNQYKKTVKEILDAENEENVKFTTCAVCDEKYDINEESCPQCNAPNVSKFGGRVINIDLMGGVPSDADVGDGVTAKEVKKFVFHNTHRYLPKFLKFNKGKRISWNWLAFFAPCCWLFSRKMYLLGSIVGSLQIAFTMLSVPFAAAINHLDFSSAKNNFEIAQIVVDNMSVVSEASLLFATIGSFLITILSFLFAVFGDYFYSRYVISNIKKIKLNNSDDINISYRKKGGVNIFAAVLAYFAVSELPSIIASIMGLI